MSDIAADASNEIVFTNGALTLVQDEAAVAQHVRIRLRFFKGEYFLNPAEGIPFYERVLIKNPSMPLVIALFKRVVRETPGIVEILSFAADYVPATRSLTLNFEARCSSGETLTFTDFVIQ